ncbi:MAG: glycoside hydrolase family 97 C-terminal domain-containing protein [Acutalibacteraceae bacterium]|nr:glycoside hydrolase family 97 C-terminal domain-containing protein [Acutalibacteraceae bacterium]
MLKAHGLDSFVSPLPVIWNETHVLPGSKIGEIAIFARRSGNRWYAAVFNGSQSERKINLPFSFLKDGAKYEAEIYTDNLTDQRGYNKVKISVTSADSADIAMRPSGGFAAVFREI